MGERSMPERCAASLLAAVLLLSGCADLLRDQATQRIFRGEVTFNSLLPTMRQSRLVQECTPAALGAKDFAVRTFPDNVTRGKQTLAVVERSGGIATLSLGWNGVRSGEPFHEDGWPAGSGRMLSCGGLFTLALREQRDAPAEMREAVSMDDYRDDRPNRRYEVVQISDYQGRLFPVRVGNELSFSYAALLQSPAVQRPYAERRILRAHYRVLAANDTFRIDGAIVPGRVFLIERILSMPDGEVIDRRDYYYSDVYGWVVMTVEYDDGMPKTVMQMSAGG